MSFEDIPDNETKKRLEMQEAEAKNQWVFENSWNKFKSEIIDKELKKHRQSAVVAGVLSGVVAAVVLTTGLNVWQRSQVGAGDIAARLAAEHQDVLRGEQGATGPKGDRGPIGPKGENGDPGTNATIPSGTVVAFDLADGCPSGWKNFEVAAGRFIIGVDGNKYKLPYVAGEPEYVRGGEDVVTLSPNEMPSHNHTLDGVFSLWNEGSSRDTTSGTGVFHAKTTRTLGLTGGGQPHNNMPPYIALYFCKKD